MRFFANGPDIPDELLAERDSGNVVFFCGAGVSRPAGLPGYRDLAEQCLDELGAPTSARSRRLLDNASADSTIGASIDQVFGLLQQEYKPALVDEVVGRLLSKKRPSKIETHSTILKLSRGATRLPQLVTTNFDTLFEKAAPSVKHFVGPDLPDLTNSKSFEGIVYLHGRLLDRPYSGIERQGFVLSSADFGRAYLAEGWATKFVRDLLDTYVIVLLGYSATDPPIRYLLEGLHSRGKDKASRIFCFDQGSETEVRDRWQNRGVTALPYISSDPSHSTLWDSLAAWAEQADDPEAWRQSILQMAHTGPRDLQPHQRGQVTALASSAQGAKLFADARPSPPAEWILVFDAAKRLEEPSGKGEFDPLSIYGLDNDPVRPPLAEDRPPQLTGKNVVTELESDEASARQRSLSGHFDREGTRLPPRLFFLALWLSNKLDELPALWWVASQNRIHWQLLGLIEDQLDKSQLPDDLSRAWVLLVEVLRYSPRDDYGWYRLQPFIKKFGWTADGMRRLERFVQPTISAKLVRHYNEDPRESGWDKLSPKDIVSFEVKFPHGLSDGQAIPTAALPEVLKTIRLALERGASLLQRIEIPYWQTHSFIRLINADGHIPDEEKSFVWFQRLFSRLVADSPRLARDEALSWPRAEPFFFNKLTIHAWMQPTLFSASEVAEGLLKFSKKDFWDHNHRRELLHMLAARSRDFGPTTRAKIEAKVLARRTKYPRESTSDFRRHTATDAASILGWLQNNGWKLSAATRRQLPALKKTDPHWNDEWIRTADESHESRTGWVKTDDNPSSLVKAPLAEIVSLAQANHKRNWGEFVEYKPFKGLVDQRPSRALAALRLEAAQGNFPKELWHDLLSDRKDRSSPRLAMLIARQLMLLPTAVVFDLRFNVAYWLKKNLLILAEKSYSRSLIFWDAIVDKYLEAGAAISESGIGEITSAGRVLQRSRKTFDHAINSPIGHLAEGLFAILDFLKLGEKVGLPLEITSRIERLFLFKGEGSDHVVSQCAIRINWLNYIDPKWTNKTIIPLFDLNKPSSEAAWNAFLYNDRLPTKALFKKLKPHFLNACGRTSVWRWRDGASSKLFEFLVIACYRHVLEGGYVSYPEARMGLQQSDDDVRSSVIWTLARIIRDEKAWFNFGKPFIEKAWPKEIRFQSSATTGQFLTLAAEASSHYSDVVRTILPLLTKSSNVDMFIFSTTKPEVSEDEQIARIHPESTLAILDAVVPDDVPYPPHNLSVVIELIAEGDPNLKQDSRWRRLHKLVMFG